MRLEMRLKPKAGSAASSQAHARRHARPHTNGHVAGRSTHPSREFRRQLEEERRRLRKELQAITQRAAVAEDAPRGGGADGGDDDAMADAASQMLERDRDLAVESNLQTVLAEVEQALARLQHGAYGTCARCRRPIHPLRLRVIPYATLCIQCKKDQERARALSARVPFPEWRALQLPRDWDEDEAPGKR
jgi:RNA polymerase-binding transcription factor DksA